MKKKKLSALILGAGNIKNNNNFEKIIKNINSLHWQKSSFLINDIDDINFVAVINLI